MWMQTYTGRKFFFTTPSATDVYIEDIAHALSMQCRYNGHTREFYSVAEHSVYVASLVPFDYRFAALMHDGAEAYIGDMISPIKAFFPRFDEMEKGVMQAIMHRFNYNTTPEMDRYIKDADVLMARHEALTLLTNPRLVEEWDLPEPTSDTPMLPPTLRCLPPARAKDMFLKAFDALYGVPRYHPHLEALG